MALYLGSSRVEINLNGTLWNLNVASVTQDANDLVLLSYDDYILQDCNGVYLAPKGTYVIADKDIILSQDGYIVRDRNGTYLVLKESE